MKRFDIIRGAALAMVSLAAVGIAQAGVVVLPVSGFTCQITDATHTNADCSGVGAVAQLGAGGLSYSMISGGIALDGNASLLEGTFGQVATAIPVGTAISYSYDFFLTETVADPNWAFDLQILDGGSLVATTGFIDGTYGTVRQEFTSSSTITTTSATNPNDVLTVEYILDLTGLNSGGNPFTTVEVPAGTSVDIDTIGTSSTPEPSSVAFMTSGLMWLGWKLRRRKQTS